MPSRPPGSHPPAWRILLAGGGAPGLTLALALARSLGPAVAVTVFDPAFAVVRTETRAYAIAPGIARMLDTLGAWIKLADAAQPILGMTITDSRIADAVRPAYLQLGGTGEVLAYMVEADRLVAALRAACLEAGVELNPSGITGYEHGPGGLIAITDAGDRVPASLLVAADGARSRLRDLAGIQWFGRRYRQSGIVGTVRHEGDHEGRAVQHFLPAGPFAILPLVGDGGPGYRSSIVWTEDSGRAAALLRLDRSASTREVETRFGPELGSVELVTDLLAFPLSLGLARSYVAPRFALLADAAHEVHPLAGQGLNLGLGDAASLAEHVADAVRLGLDPGGDAVLEGYQRDRRIDAVTLAAATDGLNRLFSNDRLPDRVLRDIGLGLVDRAPGAKRFFEAQAAGTTRRAPRLLQGGPL